jgi:hypothetical protein
MEVVRAIDKGTLSLNWYNRVSFPFFKLYIEFQFES